MNGILNLDKPLRLTSADAVYRVRSMLAGGWPRREWPKAGHAGSLDPLATGVLVICVGRATKLVERIMDQPKVYRAAAALDVTSPSFDLELPATAVPVAHPPDAAAVAGVLRSLEGTIMQAPPATSAVKIAGRPAYRLSRAGRAPVLPARPVRIYWTRLRRYEWPQLEFDVACGRGTYIRALIRDIGAQLGVGGCLTGLERLAVGPFRVEESWSLERLESAGVAAILPIEAAAGLLSRVVEPSPSWDPPAGTGS
ncbi:MAG: tRNA pseudouridine(55) synthase TruB [Planctomycetota bacterium]